MSVIYNIIDNRTNDQDDDTNDCVHTDLLSKSVAVANRERYGSTGTFSTEYATSSSSSSSSNSSQDNDNNNRNQFQHLSLDLTSIDNSAGEEQQQNHSRDSSYSDISVDGGGGYYDRYARHRHNNSRRGTIEYFLENILIMNNFKVLFSGVCWFTSYMIMGVFGGSVAYLHFERTDSPVTDPLPDFGYDIIPVSQIYLYFLYDICFNLLCIAGIIFICFAHLCHFSFYTKTVLLSGHSPRSSRKCSKHCPLHSICPHISWCYITMETTLSSQVW